MPVDINVHADIKRLTKSLEDFVAKQVPFATAQALNAVALKVQEAERENMRQQLKEPTPFTLNSVAIKRATKASQHATVYVRDIAAAYLEPFEVGGTHKLIGSGRTWLNPKDRTLLNKYGNLPAGKLAALKGRIDIYVGTIQTARGEKISGVWQRPVSTVKRGRGKRIRNVAPYRGANTSGHLKLLLRFGDAMPVRQRLNFGATAKAVVSANLNAEFDKALAKAMATAK